jgi:serine/threonine protein kinase
LIQVAVKTLHTGGAPEEAETSFLKEMQILQHASAVCQRACRMLGCCKLDGNPCIVMSLYPKSAATRLQEVGGQFDTQVQYAFLQSSGLRVSRPIICCSDLSACLHTGPMQMQELSSIAAEVLEGLAQFHAVRIWHMDLKPANILLDEYGHAYLSDFGISYALRTLEQCTVLTRATGTPHYK